MNYVIIVAAGTGSRMASNLPKQFLDLNGLPVIMHTINSFFRSPLVSEIVLVISKEMNEYWEELCVIKSFDLPLHVTYGGESRFQSVKNGIAYIRENFEVGQQDYIAVHDGARPLISTPLIARAFEGAYNHQAIVLAQRSTESVRIGNQLSSRSADRNEVWLVQTPQIFHADLLTHAYQQEENCLFTDDASVVEKMGNSVSIIEGDAKNIKITYPQDLQIAHFYLNML